MIISKQIIFFKLKLVPLTLTGRFFKWKYKDTITGSIFLI